MSDKALEGAEADASGEQKEDTSIRTGRTAGQSTRKSKKSVHLAETYERFDKDAVSVRDRKKSLLKNSEDLSSRRSSKSQRSSIRNEDTPGLLAKSERSFVEDDNISANPSTKITAPSLAKDTISAATVETTMKPIDTYSVTASRRDSLAKPDVEASFLAGRRQPPPPQARRVQVLESLKEQVVSFQEKRGIPRDNYTYSSVIANIFSQAYKAICSVLFLVLAVAPLTEITVHIARFSLEQMVDISRTGDQQAALVKTVLFGLQFLSLLIMVVFIFGAILVPITMMTKAMICRVMSSVLIY